MKTEISILIPTFNDECRLLVNALYRQCSIINGLKYEIIVADDGSTNENIIKKNVPISDIPQCSFILREKNCGRSVIRNFLARQAQYEWLLFIDSDMTVISDHYIHDYIATSFDGILYGGYTITLQDGVLSKNLRYKYEKKCIGAHTSEERNKHPYKDFHTSNFLVPRQVMLAHPFDERFHRYGYEDVLWGKTIKDCAINIHHIPNEMGFNTFESNESFIAKTEEGLNTLYEFRTEFEGYSSLLSMANKIRQMHLTPLARLVNCLFVRIMRKKLISKNPHLALFKLYKLVYYLNIH